MTLMLMLWKLRLDEARAAISAETPSAKLRTVVVDLASFASIRSAAASVRSYSENIDVRFGSFSSKRRPDQSGFR